MKNITILHHFPSSIPCFLVLSPPTCGACAIGPLAVGIHNLGVASCGMWQWLVNVATNKVLKYVHQEDDGN